MTGKCVHYKRSYMRYVLFGAIVLLFVYIPTSIIFNMYIQNAWHGGVLKKSTFETDHVPIRMSFKSNETDKGRLLQLHDINLESDGSVDLTLNLNVNELIRLVKAYTDGSFSGEMTMNKLPPKLAFLVPNSKVCENVPKLVALIYIHTAPKNFKLRILLRQTWADADLYMDKRTRVVFVLGRPATISVMDKLLNEHDKYQDLVIGDFVDTYHNLTLKALTAIQWVSDYCSNVKYVIKADDDAFINIFELLNMLEKELSDRIIACPLWKANTMPIMRDPAKCRKWCVHFYEFPGRTRFPQYCAGLALVMSGSVVREMHKVAAKTPLFWIDDVYLTGVLAPKVENVHYIDLSKNFTLKENLSFDDITGKKPAKYLITTTKNEIKFRSMWNATLHKLDKGHLKQLSNRIIDSNTSLKNRLTV